MGPNESASDGAEGRRSRRWTTPPPVLQDGEGPGPEGLAILIELQDELGAVLWKCLRSILLWAETAPDLRPDVFDDAAAERRRAEISAALQKEGKGPRRDENRALGEALEKLLAVVDAPASADPDVVAAACVAAAEWAERRNLRETALEMRQAAAVSSPFDPRLSLAVGQAAQDLAKYGKAEAWFYRAIGQARRAADWRTYAEAYIGHGTMMFRRGALPAARRSFLKALRRARRHSFRKTEAKALHDLFVLEHRAGNAARALDYAQRAVEAHHRYPAGLARLAHDIAYHWLERGEAERALPVLLETLARAPAEARAAALGSITWAAAVTGDAEAFAWARAGLREMAPGPGVAEAWVDVARGALTFDRYEDAEEAARLAESIARTRREGQLRLLAEEIMRQIRGEGSRHHLASRAAAASDEALRNRLARDLIRTLQGVPGRAPEPPASI